MKNHLKNQFVILTTALFLFLTYSCQKDEIVEMETENFVLENASKNLENQIFFALQAPNGKYISSENGNRPVSATRNAIGSWERFLIEDIGGRRVVIKASNGKYLTSNQQGALVFSANDKNEAEEFFTIYSGLYPEFSFQSLSKNRNYVLSNDGLRLSASDTDRTIFTLKEIKSPEVQGISTFALKDNSNKYLSSENGKKPATVTRNSVDAWEKIEFLELPGRATILRGNNGKYLTSQNGKKPLSFSANFIVDAEIFVTTNTGLFPEFTFSSLSFGNNYYKISDQKKELIPVLSSNETTFFILEQL